MQRAIVANAGDQLGGVRIDRRLGNVLVPGIIVGKQAFVDGGIGAELDGVGVVALCGDRDTNGDDGDGDQWQ
jgi:hypothetical protein